MGVRFLKIAVCYLMFGVFMGMFMSMTQQFEYAPSHAHINLLGWATLGLAGVIYTLYPKAGESKLGKTHFWLHNAGLPIMMFGLIWLESGNASAELFISIGASITTVGIICFLLNVLINVKTGANVQKNSKKNFSA